MKKRLVIFIVAFCLSFVSMVALSLFSMERFVTYTAYSDQVDHTNKVVQTLLRAEIRLKDIDRAERGYMITQDTMYLRFLNNNIDSLYSATETLEALMLDNPRQTNNISLIKESAAHRISAVRNNIIYIDTSHSSEPSKYYYQSRDLMLDCSKKMSSLLKDETRLLDVRFRAEHFYQELTTDTLRYLLIVFCLITLVLFIIMTIELRGKMKYQVELQARVIDLQRSHAELQEIAYAASHDLQEPLRKIQVFSNMLLYQKEKQLSDSDKSILSRIYSSAGRMQVLISDLVHLTSLSNFDEQKTLTDLNSVLQYVMIDMEETVKEKNAQVEISTLPAVKGYRNQLKILFSALIDNALKFTPENEEPHVSITFALTDGAELNDINPKLKDKKFYRVSCADNGIGFDDRYIGKIFRIFQRLHTPDSVYEGKGIGLAICQRIMANHEGYILAHGEPHVGATFMLFFPADV